MTPFFKVVTLKEGQILRCFLIFRDHTVKQFDQKQTG